jgi:hypothetical protein
MEPEQQSAGRSLKDNVMHRIEREVICPRPKYLYTGRELGVWSLWLLSIVVGAFAVAVVTFVIMHHEYELYEATHENFMTFFIEALPYLWLLTFGVMAAAAVYNLKHTKHGYRYPLWQVLGSSLVLSLAGGSMLHFFGMGYSIDHTLGRYMAIYQSESERDTMMWNRPTEGRLLGTMVRPVETPEVTMLFTDTTGNKWNLNIDDLTSTERKLLESKEQVRLIGVVSDEQAKVFHSCGVFPWIMHKPPSREEFAAARRNFEERMGKYEERFEKAMRIEDGDKVRGDDGDSPCHDVMPMRRMRHEME